jgi:hypothetical protein
MKIVWEEHISCMRQIVLVGKPEEMEQVGDLLL